MVYSYGFIRFRDSLKRAVSEHCSGVNPAHYTNEGLLALLTASVSDAEVVMFQYNSQKKQGLLVMRE